MDKPNRTHSTRAARALAAASDLTYNQALELVRRAQPTPRPERFDDPGFVAEFVAAHRGAGTERSAATGGAADMWPLPGHDGVVVAWPPDDTEFLITIRDDLGYTKDRFAWVDLFDDMRSAIAAEPSAQQWTSAGDTGAGTRWVSEPSGWRVELNGRPRALSAAEVAELRAADADAAQHPADEVVRWASGRPERADVENPVREGAGLPHDWWDPAERYPGLALTSASGAPVESCRRCGVVRGKVSQTRLCRGRVRVELRGADVGRVSGVEVASTAPDVAVPAVAPDVLGADGERAPSVVCDFCGAAAVDCHGGELYFCEQHRRLVRAAAAAGVLDRGDYTVDDIVRAADPDDAPAALQVYVRSDEGSVSEVVGDEAARDALIRFIADDDAPA